MVSAYDLAYGYIKTNGFDVTSAIKKSIINCITEVLNNGAISNDIISKIKGSKNNNQEHDKYFKSIKSTGNLLKHSLIGDKSDIVYYHNELRVIPDAPLVYFDIDSGEMKKAKQDYFLEMRASYTLDDLFAYAKKKESLIKCTANENRTKGSLKYLLGKYDVDFLLFIIDTANEIYNSKLRSFRNILDIEEYESEAKENYERRITECAISGTDKIVYKKREL